MTIHLRKFVLVVALLLTLSVPAFSQSKPNFIHRHPTATAVAAGAGTTYMLKKSAHYKMMHGERLSLAERHPYLSGMGVAMITHHELKKHK